MSCNVPYERVCPSPHPPPPSPCAGGLFTFISVVQILSTMLGSALYVPIYILSLNRGWPPQHSSAVTFLLMALLHCVAFPLMW